MKFLTKINRNYLILFSAILLILSFSGYFLLKTILVENSKESLLSVEAVIKNQIAETNTIINLKPFIEVIQVNAQREMKPEYKEKIIFDSVENEDEVFIEYSNIIKIKNSYYLLKIREAEVESEDLALSIAIYFSALLLAAFIIAFFISYRLNKTIWRTFQHNLKEMENFDFRKREKLQLRSSEIEEFDRLNLVVKNLTAKLKKDFLSLKEFTENASHEIQTPLAIASLNLEEILQDELKEESFRKVVSAINAIKRLSVLNQNMLLLTKIENNQFEANNFIILNQLISHKINEFNLLFRERDIRINFISLSDFRVKMNIRLAEILISNLISNSINHNFEGGSVSLKADQNELLICNTGLENDLNDETIFNRFVKGNSKSHGLGLAIVKQICDSHFLEIHYFRNEFHCFKVSHKIVPSSKFL